MLDLSSWQLPITAYCCAVQSLWLPFKDKLDWKTIALIVHKDNTSDIPDLIARSDVTVSAPSDIMLRLHDVPHQYAMS